MQELAAAFGWYVEDETASGFEYSVCLVDDVGDGVGIEVHEEMEGIDDVEGGIGESGFGG